MTDGAKRLLLLVGLGAIYVGGSGSIAALVWVEEQATTGPMSFEEVWVVVAVLVAWLPVGAWLAIEAMWWKRRQQRLTGPS